MRDDLIIFIAIIASVVIGGYLFIYGGPKFDSQTIAIPQQSQGSFSVLAEGQDSGAVSRRANYRIMTDEQFAELWRMIYGEDGPAIPAIDFSKDEVIAVFDGSHSSGGYRVSVTEVTDADGARAVHITREEPGENCAVVSALTSPFQIVRVAKTALPLIREEQVVVRDCGI